MTKVVDKKEINDYVDYCLFNENEKIKNTSFCITELLSQLSEGGLSIEPEELHNELDILFEGLSSEEKLILNRFIPAYLDKVDSINKESKNEGMILKKEKKNYVKS